MRLLQPLAGMVGIFAGDTDTSSLEEASLALHGPGIPHFMSCAVQSKGVWADSCDIAQDFSIVQEADWSLLCDPWRNHTRATPINITWTHGKWTCPEKYRSPSGCGDFRTDTRNLKCSKLLTFGGEACVESHADKRDRRIVSVSEPLVPQKHTCVQRPLFYDNFNTKGDLVTPPALGRHRERWPVWGEYTFLPPQRWLHSAEHGGIVFLYNQCLSPGDICRIRIFIQKWRLTLGLGKHAFRFILTPFKNLQTPMAIVSWGKVYMSNCFDEEDMDDFILKHYRESWEDVAEDGPYNYLLGDFDATALKCGPLAPVSRSQLTAEEAADFPGLRSVIDAAVAKAVATAVAAAKKEWLKEVKPECQIQPQPQ